MCAGPLPKGSPSGPRTVWWGISVASVIFERRGREGFEK